MTFREFMTAERSFRILNWLFIPAAALAGGYVFAVSGSWLSAIIIDFWVFVFAWMCVLPATLMVGAFAWLLSRFGLNLW